MRIDNYLSQLLYRYQCVTVPGFGAFLTEIRSAHLDESSNTFYPPKKVIAFNSNIKNNDGLLTQHVALSEKISYNQALELIEDFVTLWKSLLQNNSTVVIKNVGKIALNSEGNMVFEPYEALNYLTDAFGLASFVSPPVKREVYKEQVVALETKAPIKITPETRNKSNNNWLKYAAVFALGISFAAYFGNQWYESKIEEDRLAVEKSVQQKVEQKIQEATFFIQNPLPSVTMTYADKKQNYHIVAGAFREERNAEKLLSLLTNLGFNAKKIAPNKFGLHQVLYGSYSTAEEAHSARENIIKTHSKDAWILVQEIQ
jgi:cell division septation protein DedD